MMTTRIYDKTAGQKRIFKAAPLRLTILLFLMLFVLMTGRTYAASDPKVISLAKRHKLTSAQIRPAGSSGKKLVCISKGKRLKKKNFWFYANGAVYYNNKKACVQTGSFTYKGFYYLADSEGKLQTNVYHDTRSCTYYYGSTGARLTNGWHTADGSQRYFDEKGRILTNRWIENQYVGTAVLIPQIVEDLFCFVLIHTTVITTVIGIIVVRCVSVGIKGFAGCLHNNKLSVGHGILCNKVVAGSIQLAVFFRKRACCTA